MKTYAMKVESTGYFILCCQYVPAEFKISEEENILLSSLNTENDIKYAVYAKLILNQILTCFIENALQAFFKDYFLL